MTHPHPMMHLHTRFDNPNCYGTKVMERTRSGTDGQTDGQTDRQTDGHGDSYIPPQTSFAGGIINSILKAA